MAQNEKLGIIQRLGLRLLGKGLYDLHPELRDRQHLMVVRDGDLGSVLDDDTDLYEANVWVRRAVQVLADNIAPLPVNVVGRDDQALPSHPITELLQYVNGEMAPGDLWREWTVNMCLDGECGLELIPGGRRFVEIWTRRAREFSVRIPKGGRRYRRVVSYHVEDGQGDPYTVPAEAFIHTRFFNPAEPMRGLSLIGAVRLGVLIDEFARAWARMFFKNSARPDFVVIAPQGTTLTEREELRDSLEGESRGLANAHRIVVLEEGMVDVRPLNLAPKDTEWLQQRQMSREEISAIFGVPPEVAGFGKNTYENFQTALEMLWKVTLTPLIRSRDDWLTEFFSKIGQIRPGERIATDLGDVEVLRSDIGAQIVQATQLIDRGTPPNLAYETVGMDLRIPGGEIGYMPISMVPVGSSPYALGMGQRGVRDKAMKAFEFGSDEHVKLWQRKEARVAPFKTQMQRLLKREFQRQQTEVGRALRDQKAIGRGKGLEVKESVEQMFNVAAEKERFRATFLPLLREALASIGAEELAALGIEIDFDLDRPEVRAELEGILYQFAEKVNDTTYDDLVGLFQEAEAAGETIPQMMERLSAYFEGRKSEASTERIARTTMTAANSAGDDAAWLQSGVVQGSVWMTAIDGRERDAHRAAHGQERRLGEMFIVGSESLAFPGDPMGSPENIINCRCTRRAVLSE